MLNRTFCPKNLAEAFEIFEQTANPSEIPLVRSALLRFTLPGLGAKKPKGVRLTTQEIIEALDFLRSLSLDKAEKLLEAQEKTFEMLKTKKERQRQPRYYLKKFIDWGKENQFFSNETETTTETYKFRHGCRSKNRKKLTTNRTRYSKIRLSIQATDYLENYQQDSLEINEKILTETIQKELDRIQLQVKEFNYFLRDTCREITAESLNLLRIWIILGWLHSVKKIPLSQLSLESIIEVVELNPASRQFSTYNDYLLAKARAREEALKIGNGTVEMLKEFFSHRPTPISLRTKQIYIEAVINLAKFLYRKQTDETVALNYEDIPVVQSLKVFSNKIGKQRKDVPMAIFFEEKYVPWEVILTVLEKLRFEADLETRTSRSQEGKIRQEKRPKTSIAKSFMKFLLLAMFVLIPPLRQRTYRELELDRTFKYGMFESRNRFIPASKMAEPEKAQWYIDLLPADYKTGKAYGDWNAPFPNVKFPDGKTFYEYIDRWLYRGYQGEDGTWHGWREVLCPNHNYIFFKERLGEQLDTNTLASKIKNIFLRWTGTPTTPHALRHIYRTYIDDPRTKATDAERQSVAFWMQHDEKTAAKEYSHQTCQNKLQLGAELSQRLTQGILDELK